MVALSGGNISNYLESCNSAIMRRSLTQFCIQIHPHRSPQLDLASLRSQCEHLTTEQALIQRFSWQEGFDDHAYVNLMFETDHPKALWKLLHQQLYQASAFGGSLQISSIATCQGRRGWNDYLLLHHFDADVSCDNFPEAIMNLSALGYKPELLSGPARPLPPAADRVRETSPSVKLCHSP
jgi:hypothetical protein